jgi:hypothetical protein
MCSFPTRWRKADFKQASVILVVRSGYRRRERVPALYYSLVHQISRVHLSEVIERDNLGFEVEANVNCECMCIKPLSQLWTTSQ